MIDLPMFVRHRDADFAGHVEHVQALQPIARRRIENPRVPLVVLARWRFLCGRLVINEPCLTGGVGDELPVARRRAKQRAVELTIELFAQPRGPRSERQILRHIARGVAEGERKMRHAFQHDEAAQNLLGRVARSHRCGQDEPGKGTLLEALGQLRADLFGGTEFVHGFRQHLV